MYWHPDNVICNLISWSSVNIFIFLKYSSLIISPLFYESLGHCLLLFCFLHLSHLRVPLRSHKSISLCNHVFLGFPLEVLFILGSGNKNRHVCDIQYTRSGMGQKASFHEYTMLQSTIPTCIGASQYAGSDMLLTCASNINWTLEWHVQIRFYRPMNCI